MKKRMMLSSVFSRPLDELEKLPEKQFQQAANEAGVTAEKFREILARTRATYQACEAKKAAIAKAEAELNGKFRFIEYRLRVILARMDLTPERRLVSEQLKQKAYNLLEQQGEGREPTNRFMESTLIMYEGRLFTLCQSRSLQEALEVLFGECKTQVVNLSNIPSFGEACYRAYRAVKKQLRGDRGSSNGLPIEGPALVYSVNIGLNFPAHPRPRRYNDELEHY